MKGPKDLLAHEDHWSTRMGLVFPGERVVFRGKDLFHELKDMRWMELLLFGITGRRFSAQQIRLFEGVWTTCTSYPDPRIWNNRVASHAGSARSTATLAISASIAVSEAKIYGGQPVIKSIDFLLKTKVKIDSGMALSKIVSDELAQQRGIPGYARPIIQVDERINPLLQLAKDLGYANSPFIKLAFDVENFLIEGRWRMRMNIAALIAALAADQGLSSEEYYQYMLLCFTGGMFPCFIDAKNKSEGVFLPLPCNRVSYIGKNVRCWT
jgi:citrate synthase